MDGLEAESVASVVGAIVSAIFSVVLIGATFLDHWWWLPAAAVWAVIAAFLLNHAERLAT